MTDLVVVWADWHASVEKEWMNEKVSKWRINRRAKDHDAVITEKC